MDSDDVHGDQSGMNGPSKTILSLFFENFAMAWTFLNLDVFWSAFCLIHNSNFGTSDFKAITFVPNMEDKKICFFIRAMTGSADFQAGPIVAFMDLSFAFSIMSSSIVLFQPCSGFGDASIWSTSFIASSIVEGVNGVKVDDGIISSSFMAFAY